MALRQKREEAARRILAENTDINSAELARRIAMATRSRISESTARNIRDAVLAQPADEQSAEPVAEPAAERPTFRIIEGHAEVAEVAEVAEESEEAEGAAEEQLQQN